MPLPSLQPTLTEVLQKQAEDIIAQAPELPSVDLTTSISKLRSLNGQIVKLKGFISDTLGLDIFPALYHHQNKVCAHLFNDEPVPEDAILEPCVYGERSLALLTLDKPAFTPSPPELSYPQILSLPPKDLLELIKTHTLPVLLKVYSDTTELLMFQSIEAIGILSFPEEYTPRDIISPQELESEGLTPQAHPYFLPTLHVLHTRTPTNNYDVPLETIRSSVQPLLALLTTHCQGDAVAAHLLFYALVSCSTTRVHSTPLDHIPFNLYGMKSSHPELVNLIMQICPYPLPLTLSLQSLSEPAPLYPSKDYTLDCLLPGALLSKGMRPGSTIIVDETTLAPGVVKTQGINNLKCLNDILAHQQLNIEIPYTEMSVPCSISIISLSSSPSILPFDYRIPLIPGGKLPSPPPQPHSSQDGGPTPSTSSTTQPTLTTTTPQPATTPAPFDPTTTHLAILTLRQVLSSLTLPPTLSKHIQDSFVATRKSHPEFNQDLLRLAITLAKIISVVEGVEGVTEVGVEGFERSRQYVVEIIERNRGRSGGSGV